MAIGPLCRGIPLPRVPRAAAVAVAVCLVSACHAGIGHGAAGSSASGASASLTADGDASPARIDWTAVGDCRGQLRVLRAAARAGRLEPGEHVPIAVVVHESSRGRFDDWIMPDGRLVKTDLPVAVHAASDAGAATEPCLLEVGPAREVEADRRLIGEDVVRSMYQSGTRSSKNPDYDVAQVRVRQAERELKEYGEPDILAVGDPMLDLVGIVAGGLLGVFSNSGEQDELDQALAELASTPRTLDRPVYRPYHFDRTVVRGRRSAIVPIVLRDREHGRVWRTEIRQRELREFHILDGLDPRDREYAQHRKESVTRLELERWQEGPPEVPISSAIAALLDGGAGDPTKPASEVAIATTRATALPEKDRSRDERSRRAATAALMPGAGPPGVVGGIAPDADPADGLQLEPGNHSASARQTATAFPGDPRSASVVRISSDDRSGSGFYVHPNFVLTSFSLVENAILIDVSTADGATVPGLLALSDPDRDLALVHVPKPGPPVPLAERSVPEGAGVEAFGRAGRASSVAARAGAAGARLELRTEASFSAEFAGGPVFSGDVVVGMVAASPAPAGKAASAIRARDLEGLLERAQHQNAALP